LFQTDGAILLELVEPRGSWGKQHPQNYLHGLPRPSPQISADKGVKIQKDLGPWCYSFQKGGTVDSANEVTALLHSWSAGDREALDHLVPIVYGELRRIAKRCLAGRLSDSLQPTALVHEAYIRLCGSAPVSWQDRAHFFAVAAQLMRRMLVDYFRAASRQKRGGRAVVITLDESLAMSDLPGPDLIDVDTVLTELAELDEQQARIVELRFFVGLSIEETAEALRISPATVKRDWVVAKAWIHRRLTQCAGYD
jgi:RNA polymerase sigma factor (TIGR02999 family)